MRRGKRRSVGAILAMWAGFLMIPASAVAQSAIAGTVTDTTGSVLPGVTVEARSPALIEQMKVGVTDAQGQYRIIDLRPGTYSVTFALAGFSTVVREGIDLPADFTAPVSVQLRVGTLEETVTVSGATPVVDVQSTQRGAVIAQELIQVLPSGRTRESFMATVPAVRTTQFDVGGSTQMCNGLTSAYGGRVGDQNVTIDGMSVGSMIGDGSISIYPDVAPVQEYAVQTNAAGADVQTGGIQINMVPKSGGNSFSGSFVTVYTNNGLLGNNISAPLVAKGIKPQKIVNAYDYNASLGGPIIQNRLWFFVSGRVWAFNKEVFNLFYDGLIQPRGTPAIDGNLLRTAHARLTAQLSPKNKLTLMHEHGWKNRDHQGIENGTAYPEAVTKQNSPLTVLAQAKWTSTITNKLLLEAGWSFNHFDQSNLWPDGLPVPTADNPFAAIRRLDLQGSKDYVAGLPYGAPAFVQSGPSAKHWTTAALTYVTGTHTLRGGFQFQRGFARATQNQPPGGAIGPDMQQQYNNGVPTSVVLFNYPRQSQNNMVADLGLYVQDSWTRRRLTLNPGLRFDYFHGEVPAETAGPGRWVPARSFPAIPNVPLWKDVTPRLGVAYDVFGNGKTAIKGSVGTYLWKSYTAQAARYNLMLADTDTRNWNDLNRDDIAQPNELGPSTNLSFGLPVPTLRQDPDFQRERNTLYNVSFDHELRSGLGVSVAYNRRSSSDIGWIDNLATTLDDYTLLTVPDPRGNGQMLPVYNLSRAKLGILDRVDLTSTSNTRYYNGVDINFRGRLPNGAQFYGGTSTGHTIQQLCQLDNPNINTIGPFGTGVAAVTLPGLRFCDEGQYHIPFKTIFKLSGSYPLPKGFRLSAVFQSLPGVEVPTVYNVTRTQLPALVLSSVTVQLSEPGSNYLPQVNQLDISVGGTIRVGKLRLKPAFDVFNALNAGTPLTATVIFGPSLGDPRTLLFPRMARFGARIEF